MNEIAPIIHQLCKGRKSLPGDPKILSESGRVLDIFHTIGPLLLIKLCEEFPIKNTVHLIPSKFVVLFTVDEITLIR